MGVFVTTTGPGATNGATALGQAYSDSVPVLMISPGVPTDHPSFGNGLLHEQLDQRGTMTGVVAESHRVQSVNEIPVAVAQAFARMKSSRPRPEYLEIPLDLIDAPGDSADVAPVPVASAPSASAELVAQAADALSHARNTVIVAGGGSAGAVDELRVVAEQLGAAVITSTNGKGVLPEDHPLAYGGGLQIDVFPDLVEQADALLVVGSELADADWFGRYPTFPETVVRIDVDPAGILANTSPSHALLGDAKATLGTLADSLRDSLKDQEEQRAASAKQVTASKTAVTEAQEETASVWMESFSALNSFLPDNTIIAADNAMSAYNGAVAALRLKRPRSMLFPTGFGTLGYGLPAGMGAKIADPDAAVVVIQGDGGLMFVVGELAAAAEARLALPVIVYDNGGYGEIHNEMVDRGDPPHSVALGSPDFVALAKSVGCHGVRIDDPATVIDAVQQAFDADRPTLIYISEDSRASQGLRR